MGRLRRKRGRAGVGGAGGGDEIPGLGPRLPRPLRGRDGGRPVPERRVPRGGGPHVAVADAALRPPALRAGAAQPGLHPPGRQPRPPAGAAAAPPAAGAPRQVGESRRTPPRRPFPSQPAGLAGTPGAPRPLCPAGGRCCSAPVLAAITSSPVSFLKPAGGVISF